MMENLDAARLTRVVAGAVVLAGLAASIASCSGNGSNAPSITQSPTTTTTTTTEPTALPAEPTEKAPRIDPGGPNPFSPTVHATPAPTAIPGNRENTG
jgi:guanyl-specific ribonuclease Sa